MIETAYLCAGLCRTIGINSENVDTYVLRHYDVWDKECPAQFVKNPAEWIRFKDRVKLILNGDDEMTAAEKQAFEDLRAMVSNQEKQINSLINQCGYYNYIDDNMKEDYRLTVRKLVNSGLIRGNESGELMLTNDMMRILTIIDRTGIFDKEVN